MVRSKSNACRKRKKKGKKEPNSEWILAMRSCCQRVDISRNTSDGWMRALDAQHENRIEEGSPSQSLGQRAAKVRLIISSGISETWCCQRVDISRNTSDGWMRALDTQHENRTEEGSPSQSLVQQAAKVRLIISSGISETWSPSRTNIIFIYWGIKKWCVKNQVSVVALGGHGVNGRNIIVFPKKINEQEPGDH